MINLVNRKLFIRKIFCNKDIKFKKNFFNFLKNENFFIKFNFVSFEEYNKIAKKFKINCDGSSIIFNYNYFNLIFRFYRSDIFYYDVKKIDLFHIFYHIKGFDHISKKSFKRMLIMKHDNIL
ncbi:hypothetical protein ACT2CI_00075 [Candidatus Vidania fulgoroideorum]